MTWPGASGQHGPKYLHPDMHSWDRTGTRGPALGLGATLLLAVCALVLSLLAGPPAPAAAVTSETPGLPALPDPQELMAEQWEGLDTREVLGFIRQLNESLAPSLPPLTWDTMTGVFRGEGFPYTFRQVMGALARSVFQGVAENAGLLARLVVLAVLMGILQQAQTAFSADGVSRTAYAVVYLALIAVAMVGFHTAAQLARGIVQGLMEFMMALLPLLMTLLAGMGALVTAGLFQPILVMAVHAVSLVVANWVFPLVYVATVLEIASHFPSRVRLTRLAGLLRHGGVFILSITLVIFLGLVSVQGAAGAVADGVALRTAKFATGTFVPVLGGMFADALELVIGSSLMLKNALGILGAAAIILFAFLPLARLVGVVIVFRLAGALVQPLGAGSLAGTLQAMAHGMMLMGLAAAAVVVMFFLAITVVVGTGNLTVMLR